MKETPIGFFPDNWEIKNIQECFRKNEKIKIGPFGSQLKKEYLLTSGDYYVYGQENVYRKDFHYCYRFLSTDRYYNLKSCEIKPGDFVVSTMGTIGKCSFVPDDAHVGIMDSHLVRMRFDDSIYKPFFEALFESPIIQDQIKLLSVGGIMDGLSTSIVKKLSIVVPPIEEQKKISAVITSLNGLIMNLNNAIEKKQAINNGIMQQLLTGQTRLPGFSEDWVDVKLGDVSHICTGKRNGDEQKETGLYPFFVRSQTVYRIDTYSYDGEAIIVPGEGGIGKIFHYINGKFDYHQRVYKISDFQGEFDVKFVYYYMKSFFGPYALMNTVKATVDSLRLPTFQDFSMHIPGSKIEQKQIAAILSDADNELSRLECLRDKYLLIKQGVMQELLTGKTRLI